MQRTRKQTKNCLKLEVESNEEGELTTPAILVDSFTSNMRHLFTMLIGQKKQYFQQFGQAWAVFYSQYY